ncbi:MAG: hypothetical protein LW650_09385 [Planctomycetaceae bacterium]|nr:hypothetical protein [Planctomycetaceae bacterium]
MILEVLSAQRVARQEELAELLKQRGVLVTQATLSRDLRDLNVFKGPAGYVLPGQYPQPAPLSAGPLEPALRQYLVSANQAGNLLVIRTRPGHAPALASEIDRVKPSGVVGTIAGDDTVFVAVESPARTRTLLRTMRQIVDRGEKE